MTGLRGNTNVSIQLLPCSLPPARTSTLRSPLLCTCQAADEYTEAAGEKRQAGAGRRQAQRRLRLLRLCRQGRDRQAACSRPSRRKPRCLVCNVCVEDRCSLHVLKIFDGLVRSRFLRWSVLSPSSLPWRLGVLRNRRPGDEGGCQRPAAHPSGLAQRVPRRRDEAQPVASDPGCSSTAEFSVEQIAVEIAEPSKP